jgi:hypothetical protein
MLLVQACGLVYPDCVTFCPTSRWCRPPPPTAMNTHFTRCGGTSAGRWAAEKSGRQAARTVGRGRSFYAYRDRPQSRALVSAGSVRATGGVATLPSQRAASRGGAPRVGSPTRHSPTPEPPGTFFVSRFPPPLWAKSARADTERPSSAAETSARVGYCVRERSLIPTPIRG